MPGIKELDLVETIKKLFNSGVPGLSLGIGDDCAAFRPARGMELLVTTDTLCEHIHFNRQFTTPKKLGGKLASVNLSDIASMGGAPKYALLSLNLTGAVDKKWINGFLEGFRDVIESRGCFLIGGNISSAANDLSFSATIIGEVKPALRLDRAKAAPGDAIYITGTPGDSAMGLSLLMERRKNYTAGERYLIERHLCPTARVEWGLALASKKIPTAMIDVSDGVALDLYRMLTASGVRAELDLVNFPLSKTARQTLAEHGAGLWRTILSGGEDYELLFTVSPAKIATLERMISRGEIVASRIGVIKSGTPKLAITDPDGQAVTLDKMGHTHDGATGKNRFPESEIVL